MGKLLGVGLSHYPGFMYSDAEMSGRLKAILESDAVSDELRDPSAWPDRMREEWADDEGEAFAQLHRTEFVSAVRKIRERLDEFAPDAVVIFGDDQYENFREDLIPAFGVYIRDEFISQPFMRGRAGRLLPPVWGNPIEEELKLPGAPRIARELAASLINDDIDVAYSYTGHHQSGLGHAFNNTIIYLDYDRAGWTWPVIPFHVNAYGSDVIRSRGVMGHLTNDAAAVELDPPGPTPARAFHVGEMVAKYALESSHRIVVIGSSSWSHAFLTPKNHYLYPDVDSDRARFRELQSGDYATWRNLSTEQLKAAGQHELLNWLPLAGAMSFANAGPPTLCELHESLVMNSSKVSAMFEIMSSDPVSGS